MNIFFRLWIVCDKEELHWSSVFQCVLMILFYFQEQHGSPTSLICSILARKTQNVKHCQFMRGCRFWTLTFHSWIQVGHHNWPSSYYILFFQLSNSVARVWHGQCLSSSHFCLGVQLAENLPTSPRLIKTHFPVQFIPKSFWEQKCKVSRVWVVPHFQKEIQ